MPCWRSSHVTGVHFLVDAILAKAHLRGANILNFSIKHALLPCIYPLSKPETPERVRKQLPSRPWRPQTGSPPPSSPLSPLTIPAPFPPFPSWQTLSYPSPFGPLLQVAHGSPPVSGSAASAPPSPSSPPRRQKWWYSNLSPTLISPDFELLFFFLVLHLLEVSTMIGYYFPSSLFYYCFTGQFGDIHPGIIVSLGIRR